MDTGDKTKTLSVVLKDAEKRVRRVIADAAEDGDYGLVEEARSVAVGIQSLLAGMGDGGRGTRASGRSGRTHLSPERLAEPRSAKRGIAEKKPSGGKAAKTKAYPRFELTDKALVRFGWSKKRREEYSHRVPKPVFDEIVALLDSMSSSETGPVMAEAVIERLQERTEDGVPNYQVYAVLAFLRREGVIRQQGRDGYLLSDGIGMHASELWAR